MRRSRPIRRPQFLSKPAVRTLGAWMQVGDERFDSDEIYRLYESSGYPLRRDVSR